MTEQRTEEDKLCRAPLTVVLGGETHEVRPLVIRESRAWRADVAKALGQLPKYANTSTDNPDDFAAAIDAMMVAMPDMVADLFFGYAKDLDREMIEGVATDAELATAFQEVAATAFPLIGGLVSLMTGGLQSPPAKPSNSS